MREVETRTKLRLFPKIVLSFIFLVSLLFIYMTFIETKLITTYEYAVVNADIPTSFNGFKIAHFSDIHFGRTINEKEVTKIVQKINEMKPDIVLYTGDLFDSYINLSEDNKNFLMRELASIEATLGKYAISGDSDYLDLASYQEIMNQANFKILENENIPLFYNDNTPIYLAGVSSLTKGDQDYTKALTKEMEGDYFQIVLVHEPIAFASVKSSSDVVLAGHSLGGYIRIPYVGGIIKKDNVGKYQKGKYEDNGSTLYVSGGLGTENFSWRLGNLPSINLYRLYHE